MAIHDIRSLLKVELVDVNAISSDTTTVTNGFDNTHYEMGFFFTFEVSAFTDGSYSITLEESNDDGAGDAYAAIPAAALLGPSPVVLDTAVTADGASISRLGAFSNKAFIRASIVSTGTTSGATIRTHAVAKGENLPEA